jgi:hypothetical protein
MLVGRRGGPTRKLPILLRVAIAPLRKVIENVLKARPMVLLGGP